MKAETIWAERLGSTGEAGRGLNRWADRWTADDEQPVGAPDVSRDSRGRFWGRHGAVPPKNCFFCSQERGRNKKGDGRGAIQNGTGGVSCKPAAPLRYHPAAPRGSTAGTWPTARRDFNRHRNPRRRRNVAQMRERALADAACTGGLRAGFCRRKCNCWAQTGVHNGVLSKERPRCRADVPPSPSQPVMECHIPVQGRTGSQLTRIGTWETTWCRKGSRHTRSMDRGGGDRVPEIVRASEGGAGKDRHR